jgi:ribosomal protein S18 acetylase RimI-like enzyme
MPAMVEYRHLSADQALETLPALQGVYGAVFSQPPYNEVPEMRDQFAEWLRDESKRPGFDLVAAVDDGQVVGFVYGYTMPAGEWWRGTDRSAPDGVKAADKLAVMEWAVRPEHRGAGIGRRLMDELLHGRAERYATLTVNPAADARSVYERWGWRHVGSTRPGKMPGMDVMLTELS